MTDQSGLIDQQKFERGKRDGHCQSLDRSQLDGPEQPYTQGAIVGLAENFALTVHTELLREQFNLNDEKYRTPPNTSLNTEYDTFKKEVDFVSHIESFDAMPAVTSSTAFKEALPELALLDLSEHFSDIHDKRVGDNMTLADLKDYEKRCNLPPVEALAVTYAINHFDTISKTFGDGTGITKGTLAKGIDFFGELEQQRLEFNRRAALLPELVFLNQKFDEIHSTEPNFTGISIFELQRFRDQNCSDPSSQDKVDQVIRDFDSLSELDTSDGARAWFTLWLAHDNADGITRSDIKAGMQMVNQPLDFGIKFDPWTK